MEAKLARSRGLRGTVSVPGDKSISHRAVMLGSLAEGETVVENFLAGEDCLATMKCFMEMGVTFRGPEGGSLIISGRGLRGLREPCKVLDAENSGTTMRLMAGILAGQPFFSVITGDDSLRSRPMGRVVEPLTRMGAVILGRNNNTLAPLALRGGNLRAIDYISPVASAQVKSSVLLAGLFAEGWTYVSEPSKSRDHTERMLKHMGAGVEVRGNRAGVRGGGPLKGGKITVPGDISSAAFLMVAAAVTPDSDLTIKDVGTNPTRDGIIEAIHRMGAEIEVSNTREVNGEPVSDIRIKSSSLRGTVIEGDLVPRLIDEIPVLAVAASCAESGTVVRDASELKVKESNRIAAVVKNLQKFGVDISELEDGFLVRPGNKLRGAVVDPGRDHRIAMAMAVAGLISEGETVIRDAQCVNISFPGFFDVLKSVEKE
ncbi:MAG: 3-phosphoshikimate 1-carboxyvinyltransferase [Peptococcaceae bacterium]|nr:3-phosphoshikimate 1-carboxyvinyltransferase [Peptococcaceae bacterium]